MSRTWGHVFTRVGATTCAYFHVSASRVWLVRYWRRIAKSDCKVTACLTEAQAQAMAAKLGIELPTEAKQLDLFKINGQPVQQVLEVSSTPADLVPAWSAADERRWDERPPPVPGA